MNAHWAFIEHQLTYLGLVAVDLSFFNPDYHSSYICRLDLGKERKGSFACRIGLSEAGLRSSVENKLMLEHRSSIKCSMALLVMGGSLIKWQPKP